MNIFLAFAFRDEDKPLVSQVERLLASQDVRVRTGERLGGGQLTPEVQQRIQECDALIALMTRRDPLQQGGWTTHSWLRDELGWARGSNKHAIALVEEGVTDAGLFAAHEWIPLDRDNSVEALLRLAETVALWKQELGRLVKVQIAPEEIATKLGDGAATCRHRMCRQGKFTVWHDITPIPEAGGTFLYLDGVRDEHLIQIEANDAGAIWKSPATSQWMLVQLRGPGK